MKCPRCQHDNPPEAKFCEECVLHHSRALAPIVAVRCARRQSSVRPARTLLHQPRAQFTGSARAPATYTPKHIAERIQTSKGALEGERKRVTALFADLKASMELLADRDPEEARKLLDPVLEGMMSPRRQAFASPWFAAAQLECRACHRSNFSSAICCCSGLSVA